ncbi:hypothetical protein MMC13_001046 [Lambiella insularis]|nr:hypothetical protein [Lambiella insularis]
MHEGRMYDRLKSIQGKLIPVYLGNIDLDRPRLDFRVRIIHMLLMSWGGERIDKVKGERTFDMKIKQFERQIARMGVQHEDIRPQNVLWSQETEGVMFIDLERATDISRTPLQELPGIGSGNETLQPQTSWRSRVEDEEWKTKALLKSEGQFEDFGGLY